MSKENTLTIPEQKTPHFFLPAHTLSAEQDLTSLHHSLSKEDLKRFLELYTLASNTPKKAKKEVEALREKHPAHPEILNLLSFIYFALRKRRKGTHLVIENYRHNPNYLFAKINYADLCLRKKSHEKIPQIFNGKFNLKELYPEKKVFHLSAFRGFMVVMGLYHLAIKEREKALCYHYLAYQVDRNHPSTKNLGRKIYPPPRLKKLFTMFTHRSL